MAGELPCAGPIAARRPVTSANRHAVSTLGRMEAGGNIQAHPSRVVAWRTRQAACLRGTARLSACITQ